MRKRAALGIENERTERLLIMKRWLFLIGSFFVTFTAHADPTGSYLCNTPSSIMWLQIVQTPDGKVSGQMDTALLLNTGKFTFRSSEVKGSANGNLVTLQYDGAGVGLVRVSGTLKGDKLTVTGSGESGPYVAEFGRATTSDYKAALDSLKAKSNGALAEQLTKDQTAQLESQIPRIAKFDASAETTLQKLQPIEGQYTDITKKMRSVLDREKVSTGVLKAQLGQRIANLRGDTDRIQGNVADIEAQYNGNDLAKLKAEIDQSDIDCKNNPQPLCVHSTQYVVDFYKHYKDLGGILKRLDAVYKQEKQVQDDLLKQSQALN
jgi:hypothetical protein